MFDYFKRTGQVDEDIDDTGSKAASNEDEDNNMNSRKRKRRHESGGSASSVSDDGGKEETNHESSAPAGPSVENKIDFLINEVSYLRGKVEKLSEQNAQKEVIKKDDINKEEIIGNQVNVLNQLTLAKSMKDVEKRGFCYEEKKELLSCKICQDNEIGSFKYKPSDGLDFSNINMGRKFLNLKKSLKRHTSDPLAHSSAMKSDIQKRQEADKLVSGNREAGMNLGRLCMKIYLLGRPYTDYELDVLLHKTAHANVGDLNHSEKLSAYFRPFVQKVVHEKIQNFLSIPMVQTGHLPPIAASAEKGTYKHRSRHFLGIITVNPGGENFLEPVSCGQPAVISGSSGLELAKSIKAGLDNFHIISDQLESFVFDGVYFHCSILNHLSKLYDFESETVHASWDWMHRTGIVDKNFTKLNWFTWLRN